MKKEQLEKQIYMRNLQINLLLKKVKKLQEENEKDKNLLEKENNYAI